MQVWNVSQKVRSKWKWKVKSLLRVYNNRGERKFNQELVCVWPEFLYHPEPVTGLSIVTIKGKRINRLAAQQEKQNANK